MVVELTVKNSDRQKVALNPLEIQYAIATGTSTTVKCKGFEIGILVEEDYTTVVDRWCQALGH